MHVSVQQNGMPSQAQLAPFAERSGADFAWPNGESRPHNVRLTQVHPTLPRVLPFVGVESLTAEPAVYWTNHTIGAISIRKIHDVQLNILQYALSNYRKAIVKPVYLLNKQVPQSL